ncbi:hypothetical protein FQR65_LT10740 [Abscondita terminalis]|nr:hypothetical protein FQR65_LT10740 [Abscondita terminalis]
MKGLILSLLLFCSTSAYGKPGFAFGGGDLGSHGGGDGGNLQYELMGVPDINGYGALNYPKFAILDLGTSQQGDIPPKVVKISSTVALKIPKPYPVKIPHNVPYPVHVDKPYPVPVPQLIKVPQPVPVEVIKKVPVPVEVPKPYPVPQNEYSQSQGSSDSGGWNAVSNTNYNDQQQGLGSGGYGVNTGGWTGGSSSNYNEQQQGDFGANNNYADSYSNYNNQDSYGQGYQGQDDNSSSYPEVIRSNSYEVKPNQDESS